TGHSKDSCPNRKIAQSNFNQSAYFKPFTPINFQNILPDLDNKEESYNEKNNRWTSEFGILNDPAIHTLGWKIDEPSDFAIKGNSKHITDLLGWYTDMLITMKDKEGKTVMVMGNFVCINNSKPELMLILGMPNIQKLQGVSEPNKNQFCIKLHGKTYVIPTYSKVQVAKKLSKEEQNQVSTDSFSLISKDLKKSL
ncbi:17698_t:CDS:2, partial [Cetraspora pellucida]